ncbi:hypothetical protein L9F63_010425, partial [Diploptera punctata]
ISSSPESSLYKIFTNSSSSDESCFKKLHKSLSGFYALRGPHLGDMWMATTRCPS